MAAQELPGRRQEGGLLRLVTIGSVDDGKSTLIGRLLFESKGIYEDQLESVEKASRRLGRQALDLALLTDGLRAEREQGITIDVAYRHFSTPRRRFVVADCPGHEQYTRNMVTGASTADLGLLLIDARLGILTQSKRHAFIASLLGIPHVVVCINKMDLVGWSQEVFERLRDEYRVFAARLGIRDLSFVPVSALLGDNVTARSERTPWYRGLPLLALLESVYVEADRNLVDLRLPVQCVLRQNHDFRGYSGRLASGILRRGDEVRVLPSGRASRVRTIVGPDGELDYAFAPQSVTVCLDHELDVGRGDMIVHPGNLPRLAREVEAMLVWLGEQPFRVGEPYLIKHAAREARGHFTRLNYRIDPETLHRRSGDRLEMNEIGRVELELYQPIAFDEYARNRTTGSFVVIDPVSNATAGAGMIIERSMGRGVAARSEASAAPVSGDIAPHRGLVSAEDRRKLLGQGPVTLWLTGLSASGKSTLAQNVERRLIEEGRAAYVLDGDNIRGGLNRDLGFSSADRTENIRRIAEVARLFNEAGLIVLTAFISPYREDRASARKIVGPERFVEIFLDTPIEVCEARDPKGLYRKARAGQLPQFTGVSAPYEPPEAPELRLHPDRMTVDQCAEAVMGELQRRGCLKG
jgi:bifunctional enzyme CysN/CysC